MALSAETKKRLDIAMASKAAADALVAKLEASEELSPRELRELRIAMCDDKAAAEIASDEQEIESDLQDAVDAAQSDVDDAQDVVDADQATVDGDQATVDADQAAVDAWTPAVAAEATLDLTADITLTSAAAGAARNTNTFTLQVLAPAANPTDTVIAAFTGTSAAIILTITPNDGTNNSLTPVDLTTAELSELINSGAVVGKSVSVTDGSSFRALQTSAGGDSTVLADAGEGDGVVATFADGADESGDLSALEATLAADQATLDADQATLEADQDTLTALEVILADAQDAASTALVSDRSVSVMTIALTSKEAALDLKELIEE